MPAFRFTDNIVPYAYLQRMHCPFCNHDETKVIDSRLAGDGHLVRRRRECTNCSERFTTFENPELVLPHVIKRDKTRVPFDEGKLRSGFTKALEKRPVDSDEVEAAIQRVIHQLRAKGERDVESSAIGDLIMTELRSLDQVAYVRFASVYRSFEDVEAFREEVERLKSLSDPGDELDQLSLLPDDKN